MLTMFFSLLSLLFFFADHLKPHGGAAAVARCMKSTSTTYDKCVDLPSQGASLAWSYDARNATLSVGFTGTFISPSGWVAWGINPTSTGMTGARVLAAFSDPVSGDLLLLPFILDDAVKRGNSPLLTRPLDIPLIASSASITTSGDGDRLAAGASVEIRAALKLVPNRTHVHVVWNRGLYVQGYSPTIHPMTAGDLSSHATIDILSDSDWERQGLTIPDWVRTMHAVLNSVSWGFLLPAGVVAARYLRQFESVGPYWFYAHAAVQIAGFLIGAVGFAVGVVMGRASPGTSYELHRGLGVAAVGVGGLQAAALFFRPSATHRYRKYWKSYHHLFGYGCVVVGVVNVFQGFNVMGIERTAPEVGYCAALAALMGLTAALEVNSWVVFCRKTKEEKMKIEGGMEVAAKKVNSGF